MIFCTTKAFLMHLVRKHETMRITSDKQENSRDTEVG